ncbi:hypothetical protein NSTCB13_05007 [Nostoc sp. DSM 114160]|jgi:hypothetical protein
MPIDLADFSRDMENPSPNLSPTRREALISPPSLVGKGAGGLGFPLAFLHDVKTQIDLARFLHKSILTSPLLTKYH